MLCLETLKQALNVLQPLIIHTGVAAEEFIAPS